MKFLQNSYKNSFEILKNFLPTSYEYLTDSLQITKKLDNFLRTHTKSIELFTNILKTSYEFLTKFL